MLRFAEETLLLILDGRGALNHIPEHTLNLVLAGATLMDRALEDRIDTDPEKLVLVDPTPVGDDLIDPTLADIAAVRNDRDARFWLERVAERGDEIRRRALDRLVERRILESAEDGFLFSPAASPDRVSIRRRTARSNRKFACGSCACSSQKPFRILATS